MPQTKQTKQKPAAAKADRKPQPQPQPQPQQQPQQQPATHNWESREIVTRTRDGLKSSLLDALDEFVADAFPAEAQFMMEVLRDRQSRFNTYLKGRGDYEVPLFTSMEGLYGRNERVLMAPTEEIAKLAEEYILSLEKAAESDGKALELPAPGFSPSDLRAMRQEDIRHYMNRFVSEATDADLFFLYSVLARWEGFIEYDKEYRPPTPILAAFAQEIHHNGKWLIEVTQGSVASIKSIIEILGEESWLSDLLKWIADKGADKLSPCLVASKAAGMQEAWDKEAA